MPIILMDGGWHTSDLVGAGALDPSVAKAQRITLERMSAWVKEFGK
jgi:hypothetical protein